ncbi:MULTISPECIES: hypothetical protein [Streptomyces]|uniref:Uncharacterized protein n=2 Tax=Streptomyces TaxID=1883 RepID=A0ABV9J7D2_9ACTN
MRRTTRKLRAAVLAAVSATLLAGTVALAPGAGAVTPDRASAPYNCGQWGLSDAEFTATQLGTSATITVTLPSITVPLPVQADSLTSTLQLARTDGSWPIAFTGPLANPTLTVGDPLTVGPLHAWVTPGDILDSWGTGSQLRIQIWGLTIICSPRAPLFPGPFVF